MQLEEAHRFVRPAMEKLFSKAVKAVMVAPLFLNTAVATPHFMLT